MKNDYDYNLYIVVSKTNTFIGKIIRFVTHCKYNHVSISLSNELQPLYSFARFNINSPIVGGFVEESWLRYLMNNKNVIARIYNIPIDIEDYERIKDELSNFSHNKSKYMYDTFGAICKKCKKKKSNKYTCLSFVNKILNEVNIPSVNSENKNINDLCNNLEPFFNKDIVIYPKQKGGYVWGNDEYYIRKDKLMVIEDTLRHLIKSII